MGKVTNKGLAALGAQLMFEYGEGNDDDDHDDGDGHNAADGHDDDGDDDCDDVRVWRGQ